MIVHSYYDEDPRVRREAESLVAAGHAVDVFALRRADDTVEADVAGVHVRRLGVQRHQGAGSLGRLIHRVHHEHCGDRRAAIRVE